MTPYMPRQRLRLMPFDSISSADAPTRPNDSAVEPFE